MRYTCVHVAFQMQYKSKELAEMQSVGHRRETTIPQKDSLCQDEPDRSFWSLFPTAWGAGYSVSCTNTAHVIPAWLSLNLTGALELPQGCTELKTYNLSIPTPCPSRLPEILVREKKPQFNISAFPHFSFVPMLSTNNKMYHAPLTTS